MSTRNGRRNVSPGSTKQAPMKATLPVALMRQGSPTRPGFRLSPSNSPTMTWPADGSKTKCRKSPDNRRLSPERRSPGSPSCKADKSKTLNPKTQSSPVIRRTASLDTIYLKGQWPRDSFRTYCGILLVDKSTQTPDEWNDLYERKGPHTRSTSVGTGDPFEKYIRTRLQKTKEVNRQSAVSGQRHSPIHGDHSAISLTPLTPQVFHSTTSRPVAIPNIPKPLMPRMRNSVEGLNQEIERLVLKGISGNEEDNERFQEPTPDGHRAPIADLLRSTRTVNTQTPSNGATGGDGSLQSSGSASRCHSMSPPTPIILESINNLTLSSQLEIESNCMGSVNIGKGDGDCLSPEPYQRLGSSPHNKFLSREPPDGCERVKVVEEPRLVPVLPDQLPSSVLLPSDNYKPRDSFVLQPSLGSAFCPLQKISFSQSAAELAMTYPATPAIQQAATVEGQ